MNRIVKNLCGILMIAVVLSPVLPVFSPEDANRDRVVDLKDLVILTRDFVQSAQKTDQFELTARKMISAIRNMAGLKTIFQGKQKKETIHTDSVFLLVSRNSMPAHICELMLLSVSERYKSIFHQPIPPPPRL